MSTGLFRKEAMNARRGTWLGTIHLAMPLSRRTLALLALLAVGLAASILAFLVRGQYTRRSRVIGQLVPSTGVLGVNARATGRVGAVHVQQGDRVQRGDPLLEISGETVSAVLGNVRADISNRLRAQRARLESDLSTQRKTRVGQTRQLNHPLALLDAQRNQIRDQLALQSQRVENDRALRRRIQPLGKKEYVAAFQVRQQQAKLLLDQSQTKVLVRQQLNMEQQINDARQKLAQLQHDPTTRRNTTLRLRNMIEQQLAENEAPRAMILRAPRDGIVSNLLAIPNQTVSAGETQLSILPRGAMLQARLLVPSRAIGFIEPGTRVVLRHESMEYTGFNLNIVQIWFLKEVLPMLKGREAARSK